MFENHFDRQLTYKQNTLMAIVHVISDMSLHKHISLSFPIDSNYG